jgi:hypothetical protein
MLQDESDLCVYWKKSRVYCHYVLHAGRPWLSKYSNNPSPYHLELFGIIRFVPLNSINTLCCLQQIPDSPTICPHLCGRSLCLPTSTSRSSNSTGAVERVLGERLGQRLLRADLLGADERVDSDGDGAVDVDGGAVVGKAHFAECFRDTHDGFEMTDLW